MDSELPVTIVPAHKKVRVESTSSLSRALVTQKIADFRTLDLATAALNDVKRAIAKLLQGYATTTLQLRAERIYRARKRTGDLPFGHYHDLWYVPPDKAHLVSMGRLNGDNEVVFYCTDSQHIALVEVRPAVGDRVCVLECELHEDARMRVMPLGIHRFLEAHKPALAAHDYEDKEHDKQFVEMENREALKLLQEFLVEELVRVVPEHGKYLYKTTVALAQMLLPPALKLHGLAYPSIAVGLQGINFMLTCAAADELLIPKRAWELHLFEETGRNTFNARCYETVRPIEPDGKLHWPALPSFP